MEIGSLVICFELPLYSICNDSSIALTEDGVSGRCFNSCSSDRFDLQRVDGQRKKESQSEGKRDRDGRTMDTANDLTEREVPVV